MQRCLLDLLLGDFADFAFEVGVRRREQAGVAGIHLGPRVINSRAEDCCRGQMNRNLVPLDQNIAGLQAAEIDAPDHFSVDNEQQTVTGQKFGQIGIGMLARNNLVHRVHNCFQPPELLDLTNHRWLIHIHLCASSPQEVQ